MTTGSDTIRNGLRTLSNPTMSNVPSRGYNRSVEEGSQTECTLWAYQVTPGSDHNFYFAGHEADCRRAALGQRAELKEGDPDDQEELGAMALYVFVLRSMTAGELVAILNGEASLIETLRWTGNSSG